MNGGMNSIMLFWRKSPNELFNNRARLLYKRYEKIISCLVYSVVLSVTLENRKTIKILFLLSLAFGKLDKTDKIKIGKGLKVEIFGVIFSKNTTCHLLIFKRVRVQNPLC